MPGGSELERTCNPFHTRVGSGLDHLVGWRDDLGKCAAGPLEDIPIGIRSYGTVHLLVSSLMSSLMLH